MVISSLRAAAALACAMAVGGCTAAPAAAPPPPEPPAPPAACVLDTAALRTATGLDWTADATTASDTRCVYDPSTGPGFLVVERGVADVDLGTLAQACAEGSRLDVGVDGFACRFPDGGVFAARVRDGEELTVGTAQVPAGTTAEALVAAVAEQLG